MSSLTFVKPTIRYLGNKRRLTAIIGTRLEHVLEPGGTLVDLMAGSAAVSIHALRTYRVLANDVEPYSYAIARALVEDCRAALSSVTARTILWGHYAANARRLESAFGQVAKREQELTEAPCALGAYRRFCQDTPYINTWHLDGLPAQAKRIFSQAAKAHASFPYALFTTYYMNTYFGVKQVIEIDSIRYAIDQVAGPYSSPRDDVLFYKLVSALLYAMSASVSSPGHFAQASRPNSRAMVARLSHERRKGIWDLFLHYVDALFDEPVHCVGSNAAFNLSASHFVMMLADMVRSVGPMAVYIDPPYTADHYSRFYHVLNTALLYDFPLAVGVGRYRDDRYFSPFSIKSAAPGALAELLKSVRALGVPVVLSYNSTGVIPLRKVLAICRSSYEHVAVTRIPYNHSGQGRRSRDQGDRRFEALFTCRPA